MTDLPDMTLTANVVVTGTVDGSGNVSVSAQYSQTGSNPPSSNVIDESGDIDLGNMAWNSAFSEDTDITFDLQGQITDANGNVVGFSFPNDPAQACTITKEGGGTNNQVTPTAGDSLMQLIIDDED